MSSRFWIASGSILAASAAMGLGLGSYVTTTPSTPSRMEDWSQDAAATTAARLAETAINQKNEYPTEPVVCKGCGPTLAERRIARGMAGFDGNGMIGGSSDPVVRDYMAAEARPNPVISSDVPPSPIHRLPANIERFAAGDQVAQESAPAPLIHPPIAQTTPDSAAAIQR